MRKREYLIFIAPSIIVLLMSLTFLSVPAASAGDWSDDFNDLNYDGWTIRNGTFSCADAVLAGIGDSTPGGATTPDTYDNEIWINSTVTHGTWSFDLYFNCQYWPGPSIWFALDNVLDEFTGHYRRPGGSGFCVRRDSEVINGWHFNRLDESSPASKFSTLGYWPPPNGLTGLGVLSHVNITFNEAGEFNLWINGTYIGQANTITLLELQSTNVLIQMNNGSWFDNIVVSDTIDLFPPTTSPTTPTETTTPTTTTEPTTPPPPPPPIEIPMEILVIGGGIVVLVILVAVWKLRT